MDVKVVDLSRSGMALETPNELRVGGNYFVEVKHQEQAVNVEVNVRWRSRTGALKSNEGEAIPLFRVGVNFVDVYRDEQGGLWESLRPDRKRPS